MDTNCESVEVVTESWISGRKTEHEDVVFLEHIPGKTYVFYLPWYAATVSYHSDDFFPLEDRFGKHWYDGYPEQQEELRQTTMLEF